MPTTKKQLRIGGVPEHFNLPWHLAIGDDAFSDCELGVRFIEYPGGTGAMTSAMSDNEIDASILLYEGAVSNILRGHPNRLVKIYVDSPLIWGIHVAASSHIESIDQIRNSVYAISRAGSGSHLIAIVDAAERGWPTEDIKFSKVGNLEGARQKMSNGKVDTFLWEKFTTQPLVDSGEFRRVGERIVPWPAFVISVKSDFLRQHSSAIKQVLQVVDRYCQALKNNSAAPQMICDKFNIKLEDCIRWFNHVQWKSGFDHKVSDFETVINYLASVGIINDNSAAVSDVWYDL